MRRRAALEDKRDKLREKIAALDTEPSEAENIVVLMPRIKTVLDAYKFGTPAQKNTLLKSIIDHVEYRKDFDARGRFQGPSEKYVTIHIFPKIIVGI